MAEDFPNKRSTLIKIDSVFWELQNATDRHITQRFMRQGFKINSEAIKMHITCEALNKRKTNKETHDKRHYSCVQLNKCTAEKHCSYSNCRPHGDLCCFLIYFEIKDKDE